MNIAICTDYGVLRNIEGKSEAANGEIRRPHLFLQWAVAASRYNCCLLLPFL